MDLVEITRMRKNVTRYGARFAGRILSSDEMLEYESVFDPAHYLAKRFAAKEALVKALGTGFRNGISMKNININHAPMGQPRINCTGKLREFMQNHQITSSHLTLTDEKDYACACVILEKNNHNI
jgi:holo-[acyl-carrier protein] synthase